MTDEAKALVERLLDHARNVGGDRSFDRLYGDEACQAADLIEAQARENERQADQIAYLEGKIEGHRAALGESHD